MCDIGHVTSVASRTTHIIKRKEQGENIICHSQPTHKHPTKRPHE